MTRPNTTTSRTRTVPPAAVPELSADLAAGLRRLKLATIRRLAPELLLTNAGPPRKVLRALIEAEVAARDASNTANRLKAAQFPVVKTLDTFDVAVSSVPQATAGDAEGVFFSAETGA